MGADEDPQWGLRPWTWTRVYAVTALILARGLHVSGSHSLRPELGEPRFFSVGYVDDQQFVSFDSDSERQREEPRAPWVERMERVEPGCWERNTRIARAHAQIYRVGLEKLLNCFKQSEGDPPSTRVTRHTGTDGEVTLRCRAQDFYPADISLTWLEGWGGTLQDVEFIETRDLPEVGQEGEYTCRVQHEGLSEPLTLKWGKDSEEKPESSSTLVIVGVITVLLLIAAIAGVGIWRKNSGRQ
uniref:Ig-like domain-containing protein n=1 Tax=Vombatus ursinus TaxID=29139 RepID=A0A4X2KJC5_VOMUR